jgi:S1-C subfamily serine protease
VLDGRDPGTDVAVLRVTGATRTPQESGPGRKEIGAAVSRRADRSTLTPATFRDLDGLSVGALALAIGRPGKTIRASLRILGVVGPEVRTPSGGRLDRWIESDRQLPRGFAGGPLIDARGEVIGINTRTLVRGADLTVPTATLRRVVDEIVAHGGVRRGYLGVGAYPVALPAALATQLGQDDGALIASIEDGGPAAAAGLLVGDILVSLDGERLGGPIDLRAALLDRGGKTVDVKLVRAGAVTVAAVTLGTKP